MNLFKIHRIKHFMEFFTRIPSDSWCIGSLSYGERSCALGHLGVKDMTKPTDEAVELGRLLMAETATAQTSNTTFVKKVAQVNDGPTHGDMVNATTDGESARRRVLDALQEKLEWEEIS